MGRFEVPLLIALALAAAPGQAAGQADVRTDAEVEVIRGAAADQCPVAGELRRLAARGASVDRPAHRYRVSFVRASGAYVADVVDVTSPRARRVIDRGPECAPLGQAVALILATMWSSEHEDAAATPPAPSPPPVIAPPPTPPAARLAPAPAPPGISVVEEKPAFPPRPVPSYWSFAVGSGVAAAIVRPVAPVLLADLALERGSWSVGLGGLWVPEERLGLAPGFVDVQLLSASARACGVLRGAVRFGACARFFAGALEAAGSGYSVDTHQTRPWLAGALEVFVAGPLPLSLLRYRCALGAIVPLHAEAFTVPGASPGPAYDTPAIGGLATVSLEVGTR